jgi:hypothetical protein
VDALRAEVKRFVEGARRQRVLPFKEDGEGGKKKKRRGVLQTVADKTAELFGK